MSETPDIKPRSRDVTDGMERAPNRAMLRAVGMTDDDWDKPQIGVASSWNEVTPCNLSLERLAMKAKEGVFAAGGFPIEFGTISVSDGISMGHEGMRASLVSREVIADSVETVMHAERLDGSVTFAGCDKSLPGHADGRGPARPRHRCSSTPARSSPDASATTTSRSRTCSRRVGACAPGASPRTSSTRSSARPARRGRLRRHVHANTMASVGEALGMSLPGSAAPPPSTAAATSTRSGPVRRSSSCSAGASRPATS